MIGMNGYDNYPFKVYGNFHYNESIINESDPDDSWDRADVAEHYDFTSFLLENPDDWRSVEIGMNTDPKNLDFGYIAYATYQTGDTFGYTTGNIAIIGMYETREEANKAVSKAKNSKHNSWDGYFEHLESIEVKKVIIG